MDRDVRGRIELRQRGRTVVISETDSLKERAGSALKWNYLGVGVRSAASLLVGVVLARILGPKPFGIVAVAALFIGFGNLLADFGFGAAIVQRESLTNEDVRFAFFFQMLTGVLLGVTCYLSAGTIALVFHNREIAPVIRVFSLMFPLQAFGQTATSLLKRRLAFRSVQYAQVGSHISYLVVAISLAISGLGVWSLVIAQLVQVTLSSVIAFLLARHSLAFSVRPNRTIMVYGLKVLGSSFANWFIGNLDNAVVGNVFGVVPLGLYGRAFQLVNTPINAIISGLQGVLLSAYSRVQNQEEVLRRVYLATLAAMGILIIPPFVAVAAAPTTVILALYGGAWLGTVPLLRPLALAMPVFAILALAAPLLWAVGKVECELKIVFATAVVAAAVFAATSRVSVACLAWGVLGVYGFRFLGMMREMTRHLKIRWLEIVLALRGGLVIGAATAVVVGLVDAAISRIGVVPLLRMIVDFALCALMTLGPLSISPEAVLGRHADLVLTQLRNMAPGPMKRFIPVIEVA